MKINVCPYYYSQSGFPPVKYHDLCLATQKNRPRDNPISGGGGSGGHLFSYPDLGWRAVLTWGCLAPARYMWG